MAWMGCKTQSIEHRKHVGRVVERNREEKGVLHQKVKHVIVGRQIQDKCAEHLRKKVG